MISFILSTERMGLKFGSTGLYNVDIMVHISLELKFSSQIAFNLAKHYGKVFVDAILIPLYLAFSEFETCYPRGLSTCHASFN